MLWAKYHGDKDCLSNVTFYESRGKKKHNWLLHDTLRTSGSSELLSALSAIPHKLYCTVVNSLLK